MVLTSLTYSFATSSVPLQEMGFGKHDKLTAGFYLHQPPQYPANNLTIGERNPSHAPTTRPFHTEQNHATGKCLEKRVIIIFTICR